MVFTSRLNAGGLVALLPASGYVSGARNLCLLLTGAAWLPKPSTNKAVGPGIGGSTDPLGCDQYPRARRKDVATSRRRGTWIEVADLGESSRIKMSKPGTGARKASDRASMQNRG
jgi:hypothetical protein